MENNYVKESLDDEMKQTTQDDIQEMMETDFHGYENSDLLVSKTEAIVKVRPDERICILHAFISYPARSLR